MTKKQRFGLIVLIILIIASILVTLEPWKKSSAKLRGALEAEAPDEVVTQWREPGFEPGH